MRRPSEFEFVNPYMKLMCHAPRGMPKAPVLHILKRFLDWETLWVPQETFALGWVLYGVAVAILSTLSGFDILFYSSMGFALLIQAVWITARTLSLLFKLWVLQKHKVIVKVSKVC